MATKIVLANGVYDLSAVSNLKELKEEIAFLKTSIKNEEEQLENHFRHLPQQAIKSAADNLLPSFLNKIIANGTWKLLLSSVAMFANPFSKGFSFKKNIVGSAKKLGVMALIKGAYSYFIAKKDLKDKDVADVKRVPAITMLKNRNVRKA